jgi:hypothetical protein
MSESISQIPSLSVVESPDHPELKGMLNIRKGKPLTATKYSCATGF